VEFQDKSLTCVDCGGEFIWTSGEQEFFAAKQFTNEPKRCMACKVTRADCSSTGRMSRDEGRNHHDVLGMRQGNHRAVPPDSGASSPLQGVFPAEEVHLSRAT
jgi:hypothetical protein